jgi:O-antigen biosynthesis protein WbqV
VADEQGVQPVLLVGSLDGADIFLRALRAERAPRLRAIGLLTSGARQTGRRIQGCPILGAAEDAVAVLDRLRQEGRGPSALVLTGMDLNGAALSGLLDAADEMGVPVRRAPRPTTLQTPARNEPGAASSVIELKPVLIEDLLNRPQVTLDRDGMARLVQGKRVLVTGAGGTIGSELARQVSQLGPDELVLLDNGEYALWQIDLELAETAADTRRQAVIADVRDTARIRSVLERVRPHLVFHAAALKHVPMVEANPLEGLLSNAFGTQNVADAARAVGCEAMVFISTDKAVNPTSLMGASKRLAEMYCQALDIQACALGGSAMRCVTVRFGNVLGSTGSVVPLFRRQLERGGPLTVTHPDMQRYFMTVREAVGLVLQASVLGTGGAALPAGEDGGIFVLDMGEPVKIVDLARRMVRLAGLIPDRDVQIRFTGLRPGEKLYEELFHGTEPPVPTGYPGLLMAAPRTADPAIVGRQIEEIAAACRGGQQRLALQLLSRLVPEFEHNVDGSSGSKAVLF